MWLLVRQGRLRTGTIGALSRRWIVRALPVLLLAVLTTACGVALEGDADTVVPAASVVAPTEAASSPRSGIEEPAAIQATLDAAAAAFRRGDREALAPLLHDPDSSFGRRWLDRAERMQVLPLASYDLRLDNVLPDLSTTRVRQAHDGVVQVVYVVEELALEGYDPEPAAHDLFLTMVRDADDRWRVAGDADAEPLGFVSVDHLWDHGPVEIREEDGVLAIHHPDGPAVGPLVDETLAALRQVADAWPQPWPRRVPVIVPRDQEELGELLHVTYDLSNFVAFATATPVNERGRYELTGSRVMINPGRLLDRPAETRQRIMAHELVHVATRPVAGPMVPSWLDEGVAQVLGEGRSTTGTDLVDGVDTTGLVLPSDGQFRVGGRDRIFLSYQLSWAFVDHLTDRYGASAVARFYVAAGRGAIGEAGTRQWHLDRAATEVFGASLDQLVEQWQATR